MKIVFTGGGTGGHFYPLIAVAEAVNKLADERKIIEAKLYYFSTEPYDTRALFESHIEFVYVPAGKQRLYASRKNITDTFKAGWGCIVALFKLFLVYPDVVFAKGGYASFPTLFAARFLRIPVVVHESDAYPGRVTLWASKFAKAVAISYEEAVQFFPKEKTAWTGQPIRADILEKKDLGALAHFGLAADIPVVGILGGSSGAEIINNHVIDILPQLVASYQVVHQTGARNFEEVQNTTKIILEKSEHKERYKPIAYLSNEDMQMLAGVANILITRAGGTLFEIAAWGVPAVVIPIEVSNGDHQRKNAFNFARAGCGDVIEEGNLTPSVLFAEIDKLMKDTARRAEMTKNGASFSKPDAAQKIATELISIGESHGG